MSFFEKIDALSSYKKNISAVTVSGLQIGKRALWTDGHLIYFEGDRKFWEEKQKAILSTRDGQILTFKDTGIFVEIVHSFPEIVICGGGHISMPLIQMGKMLGFYITVIEDRPKFARNAEEAGADKVVCDNFKSALEKIEGGQDKYFIIVTRGHRFDQLCLEQILYKSNAYIGMIGSRSRVKKVKEDVLLKGVSKEKMDKIYSPIGLSIHAETPEEIAVSIMAEIIQVKNLKCCGIGFDKKIINGLLSKENKNIDKAFVTIIERRGSAPRSTGAKMVVFRDGTVIGSIGGGCVEAEMFHHAVWCMTEKKSEVFGFDMSGEKAEEEGMVCGGTIKVLIESVC